MVRKTYSPGEGTSMHHHPRLGPSDRSERGAGAVEYALLLALIAVVVFSAVSFFGASSGAGLNNSKDCISAAYNGQPVPAGCN
jgi:Flp pilus assembly pilin Flp